MRNVRRSYYKKVTERAPKYVTFKAKTWKYICEAIERLKVKYRRVCRLVSQTATGGGLYRGKIQIG